ncbi:MAG: 4-hydroxythreonine-4-phosphate dehydrogenase PdxA [Candidatus Liberibacter ctenarytainae]|uniref:4-hydroxythreonine-4-phosphate dehydrogenase n=1 Tax=Candidatus Liberibacter ctenarytainae TaxID=2020335 RepID=A0A937AIZ3_9HYPH|nr:4-hydroxythreonine-4-phosphate dehydrogenase PdxA [Candidatus Liberibacter ctenarytainae]
MDDFFLLPLILTQGDPAGIGPDISLKAWFNRNKTSVPPFLYIGDIDVLKSRAKQLNLDVPLYETDCAHTLSVFERALPIIHSPCGSNIVAGEPQSKTASNTIANIEKAASLTLSGQALAMVTNPIAKSFLYKENFGFPGHTEFLSALSTRRTGIIYTPVMMLSGPQLRTVPVTIHIPVSHISQVLSKQLIIETCRVVNHSMKKYFNINHPRLAISGLNPHAGEYATIGIEERDIICPAITQLRDENMHILGPLPADSMFHHNAIQHYDVAVCMYHDQALIPVKTLNFDETVNITLGLPFIRTSPDHGTAFDIAGTRAVREHSLVSSLQIAKKLAIQKKTSND